MYLFLLALLVASAPARALEISELPNYSVVSVQADFFLKPDRTSESIYTNAVDCNVDLYAVKPSLLTSGFRLKKGSKLLVSKKIVLPRDFREKFTGESLKIFSEGAQAIRFLIPVYLEDESADLIAKGFIECAGRGHAGDNIRSLNLLSGGMFSITRVPGQTLTPPAVPATTPQVARERERETTAPSRPASPPVVVAPARTTNNEPEARPANNSPRFPLPPPRRINQTPQSFSNF